MKPSVPLQSNQPRWKVILMTPVDHALAWLALCIYVPYLLLILIRDSIK